MKLAYRIKLQSGVVESGITDESPTVEDLVDTFKWAFGDYIEELTVAEIKEADWEQIRISERIHYIIMCGVNPFKYVLV